MNKLRAGINLVRCRVCQNNVYVYWKDEWREITKEEKAAIPIHGEVFESVCPVCTTPYEEKEGSD